MLLLLCTDTMRTRLEDTFKLPSTHDEDAKTGVHELVSPQPTDDQDPYSSVSQRRREKESREQELASSRLQGNRRAALTYFDAWRGKMLRRVCEVLTIRADTIRSARKAYQEKRKADEQKKQDQALNDWAYGENEETLAPEERFPPIPNKLAAFSEDDRVFLLSCVLLLILSLESYAAHSRVLLCHLTASLLLDQSVLVDLENRTAKELLSAASQMSAEESRRKVQNDSSRKWKVGLATVGGAAVLALTGGLAAPLLAAGVGSVLGGIGLGGTVISGLLGALAGSSVLIGGLFGAYGGNMTGAIMDKYAKQIEDFKFIPIRRHQGQNTAQNPESIPEHRLRVTIAVSGIVTAAEDFEYPWSVIDPKNSETFALRWEMDSLIRLGVSMTAVLKTYVWKYARFELVRRTVFSTLAMGLWPLGLLEVARVVDNPFSVGKSRADKAGRVLAEVLLSKTQGERPVTLIGVSLGARMIYSTLLELAKQNAFGLVENVVLIGMPAPSDSEPWTQIRSVISGRLINVYCQEDYILGFLYRASSLQNSIAGLQPIALVNGVENFDVSDIVDGHAYYRYTVGRVLKRVGLDDVDLDEVRKEIEVLKTIKAKEQNETVIDPNKSKRAAQKERAQVEAQIKGLTSTRIAMVEIDEKEEIRKQQLIDIAEERMQEDWSPPEINTSKNAQIDFFASIEDELPTNLQQATISEKAPQKSPQMVEVEKDIDGVAKKHTPPPTTDNTIEPPTKDFGDAHFDAESDGEHDHSQMEMAYLEPDAIVEDDDDE